MDSKANSKHHAELLKAVQLLRSGQPVALPTETVYGLAAPIDNPGAIKSIFKIKDRPFFDPLIVHVSSIDQAKSCFSQWNPLAQKLAETFWPGPLTLVMKKSERINSMITSGLENVGVRQPQHPLFNEILEILGVPLAAPSANKFGRTSPTTYQHVVDEFKHDNLFVLDGGPCQIGIESTVLLIEQTQLSILREGMISADEIEQCLSTEFQKKSWSWLEKNQVDSKSSPGNMKHHYMPSTPLVLVQNASLTEEQIILKLNQKFKDLPSEIEGVKLLKPKDGVQKMGWMVLPEEPSLAARELYSQLRKASQLGPDVILFQLAEVHSSKAWSPIRDRLDKAASLILN
jgi:L-threonylcarbamoyladenylate synthase